MSLRRCIVCGVIGLFAFALVTIALLIANHPKVQEQKWADGSVVVFRSVTYGKTHRVVSGDLLQRITGRLLPETLAKKCGAQISYYTNGTPVLMVWIEHRTPPGAGRYKTPGNLRPYVLADDAGAEFTLLSAHLHARTITGGSLGGIGGIAFPIVPRASTNLHFFYRMRDATSGQPFEARFTFPNPLFAPASVRQPIKFPVAVTNSNLTFTLIGLTALSNIEPGFIAERVAATGVAEAWMKAQFRIRDHTDTNRLWSVQSVDVVDEAGGWYIPFKGGRINRDSTRSFDFACGLSPRESWKLRFLLAPSSYPPFAYRSNEVFTAHAVPVPGTNGETFKAMRIPLNGTTLVVPGFIGASNVFAAIDPPDPNYRLRLIATSGSDGEKITLGNNVSHNRGDWSQFLWLRPGVTNVDLTFALTREVAIELTAQPEL